MFSQKLNQSYSAGLRFVHHPYFLGCTTLRAVKGFPGISSLCSGIPVFPLTVAKPSLSCSIVLLFMNLLNLKAMIPANTVILETLTFLQHFDPKVIDYAFPAGKRHYHQLLEQCCAACGSPYPTPTAVIGFFAELNQRDQLKLSTAIALYKYHRSNEK